MGWGCGTGEVPRPLPLALQFKLVWTRFHRIQSNWLLTEDFTEGLHNTYEQLHNAAGWLCNGKTVSHFLNLLNSFNGFPFTVQLNLSIPEGRAGPMGVVNHSGGVCLKCVRLTHPLNCPLPLFSYILMALTVPYPALLKAARMSWSVVHCPHTDTRTHTQCMEGEGCQCAMSAE